ncbi:Lysine-specific demethylase JMJ25 [Glycine max]|nr:Lysine-specific demethylase JMJ25 [Glycine max]
MELLVNSAHRYPDMSVEEIASSCPFCRKNCNCNVCLCSRGMIKTSNRDISDYEKAQYLQYMINLLLPFLKQICHEQSQEDQIEAKLLGKSSFEIEIPQSLCGDVELTIVLLQLLTFIEAAPIVPMNSALVVAKKYVMEALHPGLS